MGVRSPNVTANHLLIARPLHCLIATPGCVTPPGWALPTQYPVQLASTVYTQADAVYIELDGRRHAGRQRGAWKERGRMEGARDGGRKQ